MVTIWFKSEHKKREEEKKKKTLFNLKLFAN